MNINLPPQECTMTITPNTGLALTTDFTILINNCFDKHTPLTYKFYIYESENLVSNSYGYYIFKLKYIIEI